MLTRYELGVLNHTCWAFRCTMVYQSYTWRFDEIWYTSCRNIYGCRACVDCEQSQVIIYICLCIAYRRCAYIYIYVYCIYIYIIYLNIPWVIWSMVPNLLNSALSFQCGMVIAIDALGIHWPRLVSSFHGLESQQVDNLQPKLVLSLDIQSYLVRFGVLGMFFFFPSKYLAGYCVVKYFAWHFC